MVELNETVIATAGLTKVFRDFWLREKVTAVDDLDVVIEPRQVYGLLGPNGSGKSTTIKMVLGLLFPTRGRIAVFGKPPTDVAVKSRIGFLPEESYLYPFLNARETLDYYGRLFHQPRQERQRRTEMLLEMVGLKGVAFRRVGEYSKGMQRRIGLAQALINDPDLLILDEPTSGMDPIGSKQFKDVIKMLADRGKTVLLSSHLLADVEDVCDKVCILYGGKKRAEGTIEDLLAKKSQTQLTVEDLDPATLGRIEKFIAESGKDVRSVTTPRDKLESLFLRIVEEAQTSRIKTGGAVSDGKMAEFLTTPEEQGEQLIESLVSPEQVEPEQPEKETPAPAEPEKAQPQEGVLQDLISSAEKEEEPEKAPAPAAGPTRTESNEEQQRRAEERRKQAAENADRDVIEGLLGHEDDQEESR
ncbi:MAG: ATP-binding cassette domain-containing protein [Phycisphaerae bacterium]